MAVSQPNLTVEIDGEIYQLNVIPAAKSKVVLAEKEKMLCLVDLKTLVTDLGRVGAFIRIACNGVTAAGPQYTELQIEIHQLGYDLTKLCDTTALTVAKFKKSSATVLSYLQATYMYLLDNYEDMAVETLSSVSKIAEDMAKAALELYDEFEILKEKVVSTLKHTQRAKSNGEHCIEEKAKERQELEEKQKYQQDLMEEAQRLEREAEAQCRQMETKEDEAISSIQFITGLKKMTTGSVGIEIFDDGRASAETKHRKEKHKQPVEKEDECHQIHYEDLKRMASFATEIKDCQDMTAAAGRALQEAFKTLAELSTVMMQTANFWKHMQEHCRTLTEEQMKGVVQKAMNEYSNEKCMRLWTTEVFKAQAIRFYAGWVVLNDVCMEYCEQIKVTQKELYEFLRESPTYEECRRNIQKLAETFLSDLKKDQKACSSKQKSET